MAGTPVAGDLYYELDGQLLEIKRQLRQSGGYPFNPHILRRQLQDAIEGRLSTGSLSVITINRSTPFNPAKFIGKGWSIWRGPANGDGLHGDEDQDIRSLALTEVDLSKIRLETCLKDGEPSINGEEKQNRLKDAGFILLDAQIFQYLWENKDKIPESWKEKVNGNIRFIFFDGTLIRSPGGDRSVLCLCWHDGEWNWLYYWLDLDWYANNYSAVLAS